MGLLAHYVRRSRRRNRKSGHMRRSPYSVGERLLYCLSLLKAGEAIEGKRVTALPRQGGIQMDPFGNQGQVRGNFLP
jgi:hypothetical protein